ncbi:MAG: hypothetical protein VX000_15405, partial [Myxococcota bacterium]|nr:hypothetical protein [Myxococcota bacterium]
MRRNARPCGAALRGPSWGRGPLPRPAPRPGALRGVHISQERAADPERLAERSQCRLAVSRFGLQAPLDGQEDA